jgi:hypothetical protein
MVKRKAKFAKFAHGEYHFRQFAYPVGKLAPMKESNGTILDQTLFLYGTGISGNTTHFHDDLPIASGIKGGRYIRTARRRHSAGEPV